MLIHGDSSRGSGIFLNLDFGRVQCVLGLFFLASGKVNSYILKMFSEACLPEKSEDIIGIVSME